MMVLRKEKQKQEGKQTTVRKTEMRGSMHKGINCRDAASIADGEFSPCVAVACGLGLSWQGSMIHNIHTIPKIQYCVLYIVYYCTHPQYTYTTECIWTDQTKDCARAAWEDLGSINSTSISMKSHFIIESSISVETSETELIPLVRHGSTYSYSGSPCKDDSRTWELRSQRRTSSTLSPCE
jgi:hypothetical protein